MAATLYRESNHLYASAASIVAPAGGWVARHPRNAERVPQDGRE
jgi:hypothetical protein